MHVLEAFIECGTSTGGACKETASLGQTFRVRDVLYRKVLLICVTKRLGGQLEIWKSWEKSGKSDHISQSERRPRCSWAPGLLALHCVVARALTSLKRTVAEAHFTITSIAVQIDINCMKVQCKYISPTARACTSLNCTYCTLDVKAAKMDEHLSLGSLKFFEDLWKVKSTPWLLRAAVAIAPSTLLPNKAGVDRPWSLRTSQFSNLEASWNIDSTMWGCCNDDHVFTYGAEMLCTDCEGEWI